MASITIGSTVRYVGVQKPEMAGLEGVVTDINVANKTAHVFWAHAMSALRQGRPQHEPTWEPARDLKPIRGFTKQFRQGSLHSAQGKMRGNDDDDDAYELEFDPEFFRDEGWRAGWGEMENGYSTTLYEQEVHPYAIEYAGEHWWVVEADDDPDMRAIVDEDEKYSTAEGAAIRAEELNSEAVSDHEKRLAGKRSGKD